MLSVPRVGQVHIYFRAGCWTHSSTRARDDRGTAVPRAISLGRNWRFARARDAEVLFADRREGRFESQRRDRLIGCAVTEVRDHRARPARRGSPVGSATALARRADGPTQREPGSIVRDTGEQSAEFAGRQLTEPGVFVALEGRGDLGPVILAQVLLRSGSSSFPPGSCDATRRRRAVEPARQVASWRRLPRPASLSHWMVSRTSACSWACWVSSSSSNGSQLGARTLSSGADGAPPWVMLL